MRLRSLALCLAFAVPALGADEVRPISDAERAAVAADYLSRGPEAIYEQLASASALRAATLPSQSETASCASIDPGMSADTVSNKMGKAHDVRDDAKTRGPGAATWVYRDSRCAVHILDGRVELID